MRNSSCKVEIPPHHCNSGCDAGWICADGGRQRATGDPRRNAGRRCSCVRAPARERAARRCRPAQLSAVGTACGGRPCGSAAVCRAAQLGRRISTCHRLATAAAAAAGVARGGAGQLGGAARAGRQPGSVRVVAQACPRGATCPRQQSRRKAAADACPRPRSEVREESAQHGAVVRVQMAVVPSAAPCAAVQQRIARVFVVFASKSAAAAAVRCPPQSKHVRSSVAPHASPRRRRRCTGGCSRGVASVARRTTPPASPPATGRRSEGVKVRLPPLSSADTRSARAAVLRCAAIVPRSKAQRPKLLFPPPSCAAGSTPPRRTACMTPGALRAEKAAPYRLTCRYACGTAALTRPPLRGHGC